MSESNISFSPEYLNQDIITKDRGNKYEKIDKYY
jgi:hypothetical protein